MSEPGPHAADFGMDACPDCHSGNIVYMPENDVETSATCLDCGAEWVEEC